MLEAALLGAVLGLVGLVGWLVWIIRSLANRSFDQQRVLLDAVVARTPKDFGLLKKLEGARPAPAGTSELELRRILEEDQRMLAEAYPTRPPGGDEPPARPHGL